MSRLGAAAATPTLPPPLQMATPVCLDVPSDIGVLAYVMALGREATEFLVRSSSSTSSSGVAFVRPFNGDVYPLAAAAALTGAYGFGGGGGSGGNGPTEAHKELDAFYKTRLLGALEEDRAARHARCGKCGKAPPAPAKGGKKAAAAAAAVARAAATEAPSADPDPAPAPAPLRLQQCGRCHYVSYCSRACQEAGWGAGGHKRDCAAMAELNKTEEAYRAAVQTLRAHHFELSAALIHWLLTKGPGGGALVLSCEDWLAFAPAHAGKVMWPQGERPAARVLRATFLPLSEINPKTRRAYRPFTTALDATPQALEEATAAAQSAGRTMVVVLTDDAGRLFTVRVPLYPNAFALQEVLGFGGGRGGGAGDDSSAADVPPLSLHTEDLHAFGQADALVIDLDRPCDTDYLYPPLVRADTPYASPRAVRLALDFHSFRVLFQRKTEDGLPDGAPAPMPPTLPPRLIAKVGRLLQGAALGPAGLAGASSGSSADAESDYPIAARLGLPYPEGTQPPIAAAIAEAERGAEGEGAAPAALAAATSADAVAAQLAADGIGAGGDDEGASLEGASSSASSAAALSLKEQALETLARLTGGLATMDVAPSGFDHATGIERGEEESRKRLRAIRGVAEVVVEGEGEGKGDDPLARYDPGAYQVCPCPGWGALARERSRLYRRGVSASQVPPTFELYGTVTLEEEEGEEEEGEGEGK
jgi:hypothetical protein